MNQKIAGPEAPEYSPAEGAKDAGTTAGLEFYGKELLIGFVSDLFTQLQYSLP